MAYADKATTVSASYDILPVLLTIILNVLGWFHMHAGLPHLFKGGCWESCNCSSSLQVSWYNKWNRPEYMGPV